MTRWEIVMYDAAVPDDDPAVSDGFKHLGSLQPYCVYAAVYTARLVK